VAFISLSASHIGPVDSADRQLTNQIAPNCPRATLRLPTIVRQSEHQTLATLEMTIVIDSKHDLLAYLMTFGSTPLIGTDKSSKFGGRLKISTFTYPGHCAGSDTLKCGRKLGNE
jgi:hypothetical protein